MYAFLLPWFYRKPVDIADDLWANFVSSYGYESIIEAVLIGGICSALFYWVEPQLFRIDSHQDVFRVRRPWWKDLGVGVALVLVVIVMRGIMISINTLARIEIGPILFSFVGSLIIFILVYSILTFFFSSPMFRYTVPYRKSKRRVQQEAIRVGG